MQTTTREGRRSRRRAPSPRTRRTARRRTRARQRESLWCPDGKAKGTNQRPLALRGDATSTPMRPLGAHLEANPRNARTAVTPHARPEHAPHSPTSASGAQPNAPQRPAPDEPGERHRGGLGTPLEGTYFQAKLGNAICVQSLDDSLNSAIHITYRISLRSSSLREPRYPSTGVVVRVVGCGQPTGVDRPQVGWGGGKTARRQATHDALPNDASSYTRPHAHAPPTRAAPLRRGDHAGGSTQRPTRGPAAARKPVRTGFGMDTGNDPSAGSPTETLLRLLLPLNDKVRTASRGVAAGEPAAAPQSGGLTGSFNR